MAQYVPKRAHTSTVDGDGLIFVSSKERNILFYDNSEGIVNNFSTLALYSVETLNHTGLHQRVSLKCNVLKTTADGLGVLRHFFAPTEKNHTTTQFNKLHFKAVEHTRQRIYFECTNEAVLLQHILLLHCKS